MEVELFALLFNPIFISSNTSEGLLTGNMLASGTANPLGWEVFKIPTSIVVQMSFELLQVFSSELQSLEWHHSFLSSTLSHHALLFSSASIVVQMSFELLQVFSSELQSLEWHHSFLSSTLSHHALLFSSASIVVQMSFELLQVLSSELQSLAWHHSFLPST
nr:hypothetical protein Itr_chr09CG15760 [Ipomoea trifida]